MAAAVVDEAAGSIRASASRDGARAAAAAVVSKRGTEGSR